MKLLVYVPLLTPRVKYIFNFIFNDILKTEIDFTVDIKVFAQSTLPKLCYATQPIAGELFFKSTNLLLEHKITTQQITTTTFGDTKVPFAVEKGALPFDMFAASFYFLSCYEEYLPKLNTETEAYVATMSLQHKLGILKMPIIDDWALILKNILLKQYPHLQFDTKHFSFCHVQVLYPSKKKVAKNFISHTLNYLKQLLNNNQQKRTAEKLADIRRFVNEAALQHTGTTIQVPISGQHRQIYARLKMPKSYVKLLKHGVEKDYSMFYNDTAGFRAGTCSPFFWYDLQIEKKTKLLVQPVAATDLALLGTKDQAELLLQMNELLDQVKLLNGHFYFLSLCNDIRT